ncbi:TIGR03862 family flavoprotein [Undibacterium cyanobacteriorum]
MAAERLALGGFDVEVFDAMPSAGRKFLLAGKSGMNLTHAENLESFLGRFGHASPSLERALKLFPPAAIRDWAQGLGVETFVGSSGRVFPTDMKAAPLLRAWLHRLRQSGVRFFMRHRWLGFSQYRTYRFQTADGEIEKEAAIAVLALGGASWARLGSDGRWFDYFDRSQITLHPFKPSNCGFECKWSEHFSSKFSGSPLTKVGLQIRTVKEHDEYRIGQFVVSEHGVEGSLIYAFSADIRDLIERDGKATIELDLTPDRSEERILSELNSGRGARSWSSFLRSKLSLHPVHIGLLYEALEKDQMQDVEVLASTIKRLPLILDRARPIDEAISSAGGLCFSELDSDLMMKHFPSVYCAGEMLDWEAPTGGYLLSACLATGYLAGEAGCAFLQNSFAGMMNEGQDV